MIPPAGRRGGTPLASTARETVIAQFPSRGYSERIVLLVGALGLLVAFRLSSLPAVFHDGVVVLSGNDPYLYRYWVEGLLSKGAGSGTPFGSLSAGVATGEPLLVVTLWAVSQLAGGTATVAGFVLAWYLVVGSAAGGLLVYLITNRRFDDVRVSLAAVAMFAITPVAAYRTSLGFADHHAFDYLWQTMVLLGLVEAVSTPLSTRRRWGATLLLGAAVAGQTLAWDNSPILLVPLGLSGAILGVAAVATHRSPARRAVPLLVGGGFGAGLVLLVHTGLGGHTAAVVSAPVLILIGLAAVAEASFRLDRSPVVALVGELLVDGLGVAALSSLRPSFTDRPASRVGFLLSDRGIVEMTGLFDEQFGTVIGPLFLLGFVLFLGLPYLVWLSWRVVRQDRPTWLVVATYAWSFLLLPTIRIRFAGQLAPSIAVLAGLGFVHLAATVEVARTPAVFQDDEAGVRRGPGRAGWQPSACYCCSWQAPASSRRRSRRAS